MNESDVISALNDVIESRRNGDPDSSYVARLFADGRAAIARKVGEEATETVIAALEESPEALVREVADLWFHSLVLLAERGVDGDAVMLELARRFGTSGHDEKASRGD